MNRLTKLTILTTLFISCCDTQAMEKETSLELNKEVKKSDLPSSRKREKEVLGLADDFLHKKESFHEKSNSLPMHKKIKIYTQIADSSLGYALALQLTKTITNKSLLQGWIETNSLENEVKKVQDSHHLKKLIINHALAPYFVKPKETIPLGVCRFPRFSSEGNYVMGVLVDALKEDEGSNFFCRNLQQKNEENKAFNQEIVLSDFEQEIFAINFNEKTGQLIVGGTQGLLQLYSNFNGNNTPTCEKSEDTHSEDEIWTAQLNENGSLAFTCGEDATLRLWDTKTGKEVWSKKNQEEIAFTNCSFSKDGQLVIVGSNDNQAYVYDIKTAQETVLKGHEDVVCAVAISPDQKRYATGSDDRTARLWNGKNNDLIAILNFHTHEIVTATFDKQSRYLATGDQGGRVCLWDAGDGKHLQTIELNNDCIHDIKFLPQEIVICSNDNLFNIRVNKYDLEQLIAVSTSINTENIKINDLLLLLANLQKKSKTARTEFYTIYRFLDNQFKKLTSGKNE
jgi:hypothetical protein